MAPPGARPLAMVRPEKLTVGPLTANTPYWPAPEMVRAFAPGPTIVTLCPMMGSALASVMVPVAEIWIVSPETALSIAARRVPVPLSAVEVTVKVAALAATAERHKATTVKSGRMRRAKRREARAENSVGKKDMKEHPE